MEWNWLLMSPETGSRGENEITVVFNCRPEYEALNVNPDWKYVYALRAISEWR